MCLILYFAQDLPLYIAKLKKTKIFTQQHRSLTENIEKQKN